MANTYMDYFASSRPDTDRYPLISIQWPGWKDTGMGEIRSKAYQLSGLLTLTDAEGLRLLDRVIHENPGRVILPAHINRDKWKQEELLKYGPRAERTTNHYALPPHAAANDALKWLTGLFAKELKLEAEELEPDRPFQDYGIDSILIMQLLRPIQDSLELDIDPSVLFEYGTLRSFGRWLEEKHPEDLARVLHGKTQDQTIELAPPAKAEARMTADIAVVGMTCRFAGANSLDAYWNLLKEGRSAIQTVPRERWNSENNYTAGLIESPYSFDPKFFCLHENDARAMDPQALLILEETLKLFCDAGYTMEEVKGKPIGVYVGGRSNHIPDTEKMQLSRNPILTVGQNYLSANISRFFDLRGPSIVVDTACSSALVAMSMAIQSLQNKEIEAAVVGGVSLLITEDTHRLFAQRGLLNKSRDFHILDSRAGGIILGEGAGLVLLKTIGQALKDGDHIYAVIKSIAINNDGKTAGPATPNIEAQKEIMRSALAKCNKKPQDISYIEVNGAGSEVPDLIEIKAINAVYRSSNATPCQLGSTKPNIGHPLCAEGMAGFIKVVKMLHDRQIVPFLSGHQPMKFFNLDTSPFSFSRALTPWPDAPAVVAINCFADGGTNAHVIVEAWHNSDEEEGGGSRKAVPVPALNLQNLQEEKTGSTPEQEYRSIWDTFD
jgi:3-oxoacyl-(acyl-carrier-protein) synthase